MREFCNLEDADNHTVSEICKILLPKFSWYNKAVGKFWGFQTDEISGKSSNATGKIRQGKNGTDTISGLRSRIRALHFFISGSHRAVERTCWRIQGTCRRTQGMWSKISPCLSSMQWRNRSKIPPRLSVLPFFMTGFCKYKRMVGFCSVLFPNSRM